MSSRDHCCRESSVAENLQRMSAHHAPEIVDTHAASTQRASCRALSRAVIGLASAALCTMAVLNLVVAVRPVQLGESFVQLRNATNATKAQHHEPAQSPPVAEQAQGTSDGCAIPYTPASVQLEEDFWALLHTVRIRSEEHGHRDLGYVQSHAFSMTSAQTWYDSRGQRVATSHRDVVSLTARIYVGDCRDVSLAVVEEKLVASPSSSITLLTIRDESGLELAQSEADSRFENELHVTDVASGKQVATIRRRPATSDFWCHPPSFPRSRLSPPSPPSLPAPPHPCLAPPLRSLFLRHGSLT